MLGRFVPQAWSHVISVGVLCLIYYSILIFINYLLLLIIFLPLLPQPSMSNSSVTVRCISVINSSASKAVVAGHRYEFERRGARTVMVHPEIPRIKLFTRPTEKFVGSRGIRVSTRNQVPGSTPQIAYAQVIYTYLPECTPACSQPLLLGLFYLLINWLILEF